MPIIINFSFAGNLVDFREKYKKQEQDKKCNPLKYDAHFKLAEDFTKLFKSEIDRQEIELNYFVWKESLHDAKKYTPGLAKHFQTYETLIENLTREEHHRFFEQMRVHHNYDPNSPLDLLKQTPIMYKDFGNFLILYKKGGITINNTFRVNSKEDEEFRQTFLTCYQKFQYKEFLPLLKKQSFKTHFPNTLNNPLNNPPFFLGSDNDALAFVKNTPQYKIPGNEVSILFGQINSPLISSIIENYLKFFLQIDLSTGIKDRDTAIGLCITIAINNAFVEDYVAHLKRRIKELKDKKNMSIDLSTDLINRYYDKSFSIAGNDTSMNLTKVSGKSWRQNSN